jgi:outer membrane protein assembly factor BamB
MKTNGFLSLADKNSASLLLIRAGSVFGLLWLALQLACSGPASAPSGAAFSSALTALPSSLVVVTTTRRVTAYSPDSRQAWAFDLPDGDTVIATPVSALSSTIYVRGAQSIYALDPAGKLLWKTNYSDTASTLKNLIAFGDSTMGMTVGDNSLVAYSAEGQTRWTFTLPGGDRIVAPPVMAPNSMVYLRSASKIYALDPAGTLAWQADVPTN